MSKQTRPPSFTLIWMLLVVAITTACGRLPTQLPSNLPSVKLSVIHTLKCVWQGTDGNAQPYKINVEQDTLSDGSITGNTCVLQYGNIQALDCNYPNDINLVTFSVWAVNGVPGTPGFWWSTSWEISPSLAAGQCVYQ